LLTVVWNSIEALASILAGIVAGSISLIGFGSDSIIEVISGAALLWRLQNDMDLSRRERVERISLKMLGWCFIALALYVSYESGATLIYHEAPTPSIAGIIIALVSLVAMPLLARAKRKVATEIGSKAMHADSRQTDFCAYLSAILLGGLLLNLAFGWWWADPIAGLLMVPIIGREAARALRGEACCHGCS
jgi:divalent metal cation (Fe/Co/Zn/Cd) transporter